MIDFPNEADIIKGRIQRFFDIIDKLFADTNKKIDIQDSRLVFQQDEELSRSKSTIVWGETITTNTP